MRNYIIIIFFFILGCHHNDTNNDPDTSINGQVINRMTGLPEPNVKLKFVECDNPYMHSPSCDILGYATTDNNGNFSFNYHNISYKYHYFMLHENGYMHSDTTYGIINEGSLTNGSSQTINLSVLPYSRIWHKIDNLNCFDSTDVVEIYHTNDILNYQEFPNPWSHYGCANFESMNWEEVPMGNNYFHWRVTKNNIVQDFYDTLYLAPGQDTIYQIAY